MYERVTPTRVACACLATLASASCAVRSSANSASGCIGRAVPVVVTWTGMPCRADQRPATSPSASLSRAVSSDSGRSASTDRRASDRLSRASLVAALEVAAPAGRVVGGLLGRLELGDDPGQPLGQGVVDLPGHPLPLVEDAGLPGLGQQLLLQARVLGQTRLEPAVGLAQLAERALAGSTWTRQTPSGEPR